MSTCSAERRPILKAYDVEKKRYLLFQPRCKMWKCPSCARVNKLLWQARISYGYEQYERLGYTGWAFVTITAMDYDDTEAKCLSRWHKNWPRLSARMRRKFPGIKYVLLPEHHENGRVHWHMIASHGVGERWVKDNAHNCGLGYIADSRPVEDAYRAVSYVSKYIGKSLDVVQWPRNLRRIRTSSKWPLLPPDDDYVGSDELIWIYWHMYTPEGLDYIAHELEKETGVKVEVIGKGV